jgi:hypothetical protein
VLANAEAGVRQLQSREMEVKEAGRGIFAFPVERRLKRSLPNMQQWVKATKDILNLMVSRRERRVAENQLDIRIAATTVVTEEMEQASDTAKEKEHSSGNRATKSREAKSVHDRENYGWIRQAAQEKKIREEEERRRKGSSQTSKDRQGRDKEESGEKHIQVHKGKQNAPKPNTVTQVDRIRRGRLPKFKTYVDAADEPSWAQQEPDPQENTSPKRGSMALNLQG